MSEVTPQTQAQELRHFYELNPGLVVDLRPLIWQAAPEWVGSPQPLPACDLDTARITAAQNQTATFPQAQTLAVELPTVHLNEMPLVVESAFNGTAAADQIRGTNASDVISGGSGRDSLSGLSGVDILCGEDGRDLLHGNQGGDRLSGGNGADTLHGGAGADNLQGGRGRDRLWGGNGDDFLRGDEGVDTLVGNAGRDVFVLQSTPGIDTIEDFVDGEDQLGLMDLSFEAIAFVQMGADVVVQVNQQDLALLRNTSAAAMTIEDFVQVAIAW